MINEIITVKPLARWWHLLRHWQAYRHPRRFKLGEAVSVRLEFDVEDSPSVFMRAMMVASHPATPLYLVKLDDSEYAGKLVVVGHAHEDWLAVDYIWKDWIDG